MQLKLNKMKNLIYIILLIIISAACTARYETGKEMADEVRYDIPQISVEELKAKMLNDEEFHLLDVRQLSEYDNGFVNQNFDFNFYIQPINVPRGILESRMSDEEFWIDFFEGMPHRDTSEIIVYCKSGSRSLLAAKTLIKLGYKNVKNLTGGYNAFNPNHEDQPAKKEESGCGG